MISITAALLLAACGQEAQAPPEESPAEPLPVGPRAIVRDCVGGVTTDPKSPGAPRSLLLQNIGTGSGDAAAPVVDLLGDERASMSGLDAALQVVPGVQQASSAAEPAPAAKVARRPARLGWGDTVQLSNDDSMSLASAQRLLWAVESNYPISPAQVRPHELLNYFTFATAPVGDATFSVLSAAERTANDTLSIAFAVRGAVPPRTPLDLTLVLDRSESMSAGGRMEYLKRGLLRMTESLHDGDRVDLVLFDDRVCTSLEDYVVGRDGPELLTSAIRALAPRGNTDLDLGLREGYRVATTRDGAASTGRNRRMLLITDALLNTGEIDPDTVTEVAKRYESSGIRLTAIGVGRGFDDAVLDTLTEKGKGAYVYLGSEAVVDRIFGPGFDALTRTIAHDVRFSVDLPRSLAMRRFYGEEASTDVEDIQPIHYFAGTTQLFLQDVAFRRLVTTDPVTFTIDYQDAVSGAPAQEVHTTTVGALLAADPANVRKARALMAWTDLLLVDGERCAPAQEVWRTRAGEVADDAEIAWLKGITPASCRGRSASPVQPPKPMIRGRPSVTLGQSDVEVAFGSPDSIAVLLQISRGRFQTCTDEASKVNPAVSGRVALGWKISAGRVTDAHVASNDTGEAELGDCFVHALRGLRFPLDTNAEVRELPIVIGRR
jgi:Ca-activated chloride channel family protein